MKKPMILGEYRRLLKFLRPHLALFFIASGCIFLSTLFDGARLVSIVPLIDKVFTGKEIVIPPEAKLPSVFYSLVDKINALPALFLLKFLIVGMILLFFMKAITTFWQGFLMSKLGQTMVRDVRNKLFKLSKGFSLLK